MNDVKDMDVVELEIVDLGEATDLTKGVPQGLKSEAQPFPNNRKIA
jgi:hypothetical protein